jgi:hypothetical protein
MCRNPARMSAPWPLRLNICVGQEWLLRVDIGRSGKAGEIERERHSAKKKRDAAQRLSVTGCRRLLAVVGSFDCLSLGH